MSGLLNFFGGGGGGGNRNQPMTGEQMRILGQITGAQDMPAELMGGGGGMVDAGEIMEKLYDIYSGREMNEGIGAGLAATIRPIKMGDLPPSSAEEMAEALICHIGGLGLYMDREPVPEYFRKIILHESEEPVKQLLVPQLRLAERAKQFRGLENLIESIATSQRKPTKPAAIAETATSPQPR